MQFTTPEGGVTTYEPHETSNTPPGAVDPAGQAIGPLPDYGTAVPDQGGSLVDKAKAAIQFLESLPEAIMAEVRGETAPASEEPADVVAGSDAEAQGETGGVSGDQAPDSAPVEAVAPPEENAAAPETEPAPVVSEGTPEPATGEATASDPEPSVITAGAEVDFADGGKTTTDDGDGEKLKDSTEAVITNPASVAGDTSQIQDQSAEQALGTELTQEGTGDQQPS